VYNGGEGGFSYHFNGKFPRKRVKRAGKLGGVLLKPLMGKVLRPEISGVNP